jgi:beta-lactamase class A
MRRLMRLIVLCAAVGAAGNGMAGAAPPADLEAAVDPGLQRALERVVAELGLGPDVDARRLALAIGDLTVAESPRLAMLNGNEMMYAASLPKLAILLGAFVEAQLGRLRLDASHLAAIHDMIRHSSNEAATRVLGWVGRERLLDILQAPGIALYDSTRWGGLWVGKAYGADAAYRRDPVAQLSHGATAFQVVRFYYLLEARRLVNPALTALMKDALARPAIRHKFVKGLESRPAAELFRKSGTWRDFHADSALIQSGRHTFVIVGLAHHPQGGEWLARIAAPLHDLIVAPPAPPGSNGESVPTGVRTAIASPSRKVQQGGGCPGWRVIGGLKIYREAAGGGDPPCPALSRAPHRSAGGSVRPALGGQLPSSFVGY